MCSVIRSRWHLYISSITVCVVFICSLHGTICPVCVFLFRWCTLHSTEAWDHWPSWFRDVDRKQTSYINQLIRFDTLWFLEGTDLVFSLMFFLCFCKSSTFAGEHATLFFIFVPYLTLFYFALQKTPGLNNHIYRYLFMEMLYRCACKGDLQHLDDFFFILLFFNFL